MTPKKIVLTRFPFTDLSSSKRRPAVILTNRKSNSPDVIVAFISSVIPIHIEDTDFVLQSNHPDFSMTGLQKTSVFKMDKLATLDVHIFTGEMGEVSDLIFEQLKIRLRKALDL